MDQCIIDGCERAATCKSMCQLHYRRAWAAGRYKVRRLPIICFVPECTELAQRRGACKRHASSISQAHRLRTDPEFRAYRRRYVDEYALKNPEKRAAQQKTHVNKAHRVTQWHTWLATSCRTSARRRLYPCDIDAAYILALWKKQEGRCHWLSVEMVPNIENRNPLRPSIDKLIPKLGYVPGNVVLCCQFANMGRNDYPADRFAEFVATLRASMRG